MNEYVRACNLHVGDVIEHPETHQLGQVGRLHLYPEAVVLFTIAGYRWQLEPGRALRLEYRPW